MMFHHFPHFGGWPLFAVWGAYSRGVVPPLPACRCGCAATGGRGGRGGAVRGTLGPEGLTFRVVAEGGEGRGGQWPSRLLAACLLGLIGSGDGFTEAGLNAPLFP